jgi:hypothetical protein
MLLWSTRINLAVFAVFPTLEITEVILFMAGAGQSGGANVIKFGGYVGIATAVVAWYTSAAVVVNNMASRPVGPPLWAATAGTAPAAVRAGASRPWDGPPEAPSQGLYPERAGACPGQVRARPGASPARRAR